MTGLHLAATARNAAASTPQSGLPSPLGPARGTAHRWRILNVLILGAVVTLILGSPRHGPKRVPRHGCHWISPPPAPPTSSAPIPTPQPISSPIVAQGWRVRVGCVKTISLSRACPTTAACPFLNPSRQGISRCGCHRPGMPSFYPVPKAHSRNRSPSNSQLASASITRNWRSPLHLLGEWNPARLAQL